MITSKQWIEKYGPLEAWPTHCRIDFRGLADGIVDMVQREPAYEGALMAGMLPGPIMEQFLGLLEMRMKEILCDRYHMAKSADNLAMFVLAPRQWRNCKHTLTCEILAVASERGILRM